MKIKETKYIVLVPEPIDFDKLHNSDGYFYGTGYLGLKLSDNISCLKSFQSDYHKNILSEFTLYKTKELALAAIKKAFNFVKEATGKYINGLPIKTYIDYLNKLDVFEVEITHQIKGI